MKQVRCATILFLLWLLAISTALASPLTIDFKDTDVRDCLRILAAQQGVNIVPSSDVTGKVTIHLHNVDFEQALTSIVESVGCTWRLENSMYRVEKKTAPLPYSIRYEEGLLSVEAKSVPIADLLREIARISGKNIIPDQSVTGNVSVLLAELPFDDALRQLLAANGFKLRIDKPYYFVSKHDLRREISYRNQLLTIDVNNADLLAVLGEISNQTGANILVEPGISGTVTGKLANLPLDIALRSFLEANGFQLDYHNQVYTVRQKPPSPTMNFQINRDQDGLFNIDASGVELSVLLRELAKRSEVNLVLQSSVKATINSVQLERVSLEEAFDYLLQGTTFAWTKIDNTYLVGDTTGSRPEASIFVSTKSFQLKYLKAEEALSLLPPYLPAQNIRAVKEKNMLLATGSLDFLNKLEEFLAAIDQPAANMTTTVIPLDYLKAEETVNLLPPNLKKHEIVVLPAINSLAVQAPEHLAKELADYLKSIDKPQPQILFDVLVLELVDQTSQDIGLDLGFKLGSAEMSLDTASFNLKYETGVNMAALTANLHTLIESGKAQIRANPKLIALSGSEASFNVVTQTRYREPRYDEDTGKMVPDGIVRVVDTGIKLSLKPWVSAANQITIDIQPDISDYLGDAYGMPRTSDRSAKTTLRVQDGETIIIGGLIQQVTQTDQRKVPILGDLPLIGPLFRYEKESQSQNEFIIYITPHLVTEASETIDPRFPIPD